MLGAGGIAKVGSPLVSALLVHGRIPGASRPAALMSEQRDAVMLSYQTRSWGAAEWKSINQRVPITWTDCGGLWSLCKKILAAASPGDGDEPMFAVEQIVKDFHDLDKNATALRYSKNKNGMTILLTDKPIDLENVQNVMEALDNFFKGADGFLSDLAAAQPDY